METPNNTQIGKFIHLVTLNCKDEQHAKQCLSALANYGKPDALSYNCLSYEFGRKANSKNTVYLIERWSKWKDLDLLLNDKVIPALSMYNQLLKNPFNPETDTLRIELSNV